MDEQGGQQVLLRLKNAETTIQQLKLQLQTQAVTIDHVQSAASGSYSQAAEKNSARLDIMRLQQAMTVVQSDVATLKQLLLTPAGEARNLNELVNASQQHNQAYRKRHESMGVPPAINQAGPQIPPPSSTPSQSPMQQNVKPVSPAGFSPLPQLSAVVPQASPPNYGPHATDGLMTLGHAAEQAANGLTAHGPLTAGAVLDATVRSEAGKKKRRNRSESLQLGLDEDEVIKELTERGFLHEAAAQEPPNFKGGRPPLGMGPYKKVKDLYIERKLTMEDWRVYYAEKCRELGYDGAFRKDLRPRLNSTETYPTFKTQDSAVPVPPGSDKGCSVGAAKFPSSNPNIPPTPDEITLLQEISPDLQLPEGVPDGVRFTWDHNATNADNVANLREYLNTYKPAQMRRGKKPDGIAHFPALSDLWSGKFIEASHFRKALKTMGMAVTPTVRSSPTGAAASAPHGSVNLLARVDSGAIPGVPGHADDMAALIPAAPDADDGVMHDVPPPAGEEVDMQVEHGHDEPTVARSGAVSNGLTQLAVVPPTATNAV